MIQFRPMFFVLALVTVLVGSTTGQQLPNAFPRDGATKILENERVIVWDLQLKQGQRVPMHTHPYDVVSVTLTDGGHQDHGADGVVEDRIFKLGDVQFRPRAVRTSKSGQSIPRGGRS